MKRTNQNSSLRQQRMMILLLSVALLSSGCASLGTFNPATGKREFIIIPTDEEVRMGQEIHQQLAGEFKFSSDAVQGARLKRIGQKVTQVSDRQDYEYHFYLIEKDDLNAFTTPGGNIYVFSGLLKELKSDDEVASVLAHETGHCAARHTVKKFQAATGYKIIGDLVFSRVQAADQIKSIAAAGSNTVMNLIFSAYSRGDEYEADRLGLKYMSLAGYSLGAMIKTFEMLDKKSEGSQGPLLLLSHPYLKDRIKAARKEIERIQGEPAG